MPKLGIGEGAMSKDVESKSGPPQIIRLDKAFKLAEQWVNNMTKVVEEEPKEVEPAGRPLKLGLGAKNVRQFTVGPLNDPVERKLHAKLEASKRKAAKLPESSPKRDGGNDHGSDDDSDRELESRTTIFTKKRIGPAAPSPQLKKKQKIKHHGPRRCFNGKRVVAEGLEMEYYVWKFAKVWFDAWIPSLPDFKLHSSPTHEGFNCLVQELMNDIKTLPGISRLYAKGFQSKNS